MDDIYKAAEYTATSYAIVSFIIASYAITSFTFIITKTARHFPDHQYKTFEAIYIKNASNI